MRIAILGYGKMGKEIEKISLERNHSISLVIDINNLEEFTAKNLNNSDVAIDFSVPDSAYKNILKCFEADIPIVSGTTGWLDKYDEIIKICKEKNKSFFYASNYSLGVNILFFINNQLAKIMNKFPDYQVKIDETHHTQKLDKPSGTAISLANDIIKQINRKTKWELAGQVSENTLNINSFRIENVFGIHEISYDSPVDVLKIKHSAKSRKGFAVGAILAAEYIIDKKGVFQMENLLGFQKS